MECRRILLQAGADPTLSARLYDDIDDFPFILRLYDVYNHVSTNFLNFIVALAYPIRSH